MSAVRRATLVFFCAVALSAPAHALTTEEMNAEIQALLAEIAALQQQLAVLAGTSAPSSGVAGGTTLAPGQSAPFRCPSLYRDLARGASGADVVDLQAFLAYEGYFNAEQTGFFGSITEAALQRWQVAQGVVQTGTPATTGFGAVGPRTRAAIINRCVAWNQSGASIVATPASCPIAPPPSTVCSTGWQPKVDANGCTLSYRCAIPLPTYTSCKERNKPICESDEVLVSRGTDEDGCSRGYRCVASEDESGGTTIPESVLAKYSELIPTYGQSVGITIKDCVKGSDKKYLVAGSGGFTASTYYYEYGGGYLGVVHYNDTPPYQAGTKPFDDTTYQCTDVKKMEYGVTKI